MTTLFDRYEAQRRKLLMDRSAPGRVGTTLPPNDVPEAEMPPSGMLRRDLDLPEVSESEIVR